MESADLGLAEITVAPASEVRSSILQAERECFNFKQNLENLQLDFYMTFMNLLTAVDFFNPILSSVSKEIQGRFNPRSKIAIHAAFVCPGEFCDTPGYFKINFLSSGFVNTTQEWDKDFCRKATAILSPYVQKRVRFYMDRQGWKVWWTPDHFCIQDKNEYQLVQDALILGSLFKEIQPLSLYDNRVEPSSLSRFDSNCHSV